MPVGSGESVESGVVVGVGFGVAVGRPVGGGVRVGVCVALEPPSVPVGSAFSDVPGVSLGAGLSLGDGDGLGDVEGDGLSDGDRSGLTDGSFVSTVGVGVASFPERRLAAPTTTSEPIDPAAIATSSTSASA